MRAARAASAARWANHHRRAFIIRFVLLYRGGGISLALAPCAFERGTVAFGTEALQKLAVLLDARSDEIFAGLFENRLPLQTVGGQQRLAAPSSQQRLQLPSQVHRILEAVVEAVAAIRRMA